MLFVDLCVCVLLYCYKAKLWIEHLKKNHYCFVIIECDCFKF